MHKLHQHKVSEAFRPLPPRWDRPAMVPRRTCRIFRGMTTGRLSRSIFDPPLLNVPYEQGIEGYNTAQVPLLDTNVYDLTFSMEMSGFD
jgi:hypothetical protein